MKYLANDVGQVVMFSSDILHQYAQNALERDGRQVIAGGFCVVRARKNDCGDGNSLLIFCSGDSLSVGVKSRGVEDEELIRQALHKPA